MRLDSSSVERIRCPAHAWVGLLLITICWPLNWAVKGSTAYLFFPLWLGYVLVVDALVTIRTGSSIWTRSRKDFVVLFATSSPVWWLFEIINQRTANWEYLGSNRFTTVEYYLLCTISFSTVMPAIFETAELVGTLKWIGRFADGPHIQKSGTLVAGIFLGGTAMLMLTLAWPKYCYLFVWTSLVLILDPVNRWLGRENFLEYLERGDWRPIISLSIGALICGFFWEMWNYYSWPKWVYHTPGTQFLHIFEMPLVGYGGYVPFALELFELRNILWRKAPRSTLSTPQTAPTALDLT
jgi:hypothetical protein